MVVTLRVQEKCIVLFKREDSNKCKESALRPIISMIKHHHEESRELLLRVVKPEVLAK